MKPIAFFAYKRPMHTSQSLESLALNEGAEESRLFIFCDGPKGPEDEETVRQTREVVRSKQWCGTVCVIERENNLGCANSIISGVTSVCGEYGCVIVLEDDLILSPFFLDYMTRALDLYRDNDRVVQISGHMFPVELHETTDAMFLPFTTSWGWATWERAWRHFDPHMSGYEKLKKDKRLRYKFNLSGAYPYYEMIESQMNGQIDSWGIRWYLSTFLFGGLTLHPNHSLVRHVGFDESGTHCKSDSGVFGTEIWKNRVVSFPKVVVESRKATNAILDHFKRHRKPSKSFLNRLRDSLLKQK